MRAEAKLEGLIKEENGGGGEEGGRVIFVPFLEQKGKTSISIKSKKKKKVLMIKLFEDEDFFLKFFENEHQQSTVPRTQRKNSIGGSRRDRRNFENFEKKIENEQARQRRVRLSLSLSLSHSQKI